MDSDPHPAERERLRSALSALIDVFVSREATAEELRSWAAIVEGFAEQVRDDPPESVLWGVGSRTLFAMHGVLAPPGYVAPPARNGDTVSAALVFGADQEGHRGLAHGGSIAQAFDYLLGTLNAFGDGTCFTSELHVRFLKPVPLHQRLDMEARVDSVEGNRYRVSGRARIGQAVCAEADAVLVSKRAAPSHSAP